MTEHIRRAGAVAWAVVGLALMLGVLGLVAWTVRVIFPPLILAGAIVFILNPVVSWLQRRGLHRALGTALAYLGIVVVFVGAGFGLRPVVAHQVDELRDRWPEVRDKVNRWIDDRAEASKGKPYEFTREELYDFLSTGDRSIGEQINRVRDLGVRVLHVLLVLVLGPVLAFYMLVDLPRLRSVAQALVPEHARAEVTVVARRLNQAIGGFFRGQVLVVLIVGVLCSIGLCGENTGAATAIRSRSATITSPTSAVRFRANACTRRQRRSRTPATGSSRATAITRTVPSDRPRRRADPSPG